MRWAEKAACRGLVDLWFDTPVGGLSVSHTAYCKEVCASCPVKDECLDAWLSMEHLMDDWAVVAGLTPRERRGMRRKWKQKQVAA